LRSSKFRNMIGHYLSLVEVLYYVMKLAYGYELVWYTYMWVTKTQYFIVHIGMARTSTSVLNREKTRRIYINRRWADGKQRFPHWFHIPKEIFTFIRV